jgi:poly-gamma-glutamate synthesis protein (capsule biosynthesis protein)
MEVQFRNPAGARLAGSLELREAEQPPVVVFAHGLGSGRMSSRNRTIAERLLGEGVAAFLIDFTGHGDSEGSVEEATVERMVEDLGAAVAFLEERPEVDSTQIGVSGSSSGGIVSVLSAARDPRVATLVLRSVPAVALLEAAARITVPTLAIAGGGDVPIVEEDRALASAPPVRGPGAGGARCRALGRVVRREAARPGAALTEADVPGPLTLAFAGDVMLGRNVNKVIGRRGYAYPWGETLPLFREADLRFANLECALTARREPWHDGDYKAFYFRAEPAVVETLHIAGVDFVSLANNHACDFGADGMLETIGVLDAAGIAHAGAGATLAEAAQPAMLEAGGVRVAVVAFADHPMGWAAGAEQPGCNYTPVSLAPDDFAPVERAIRSARSSADLVVFCIHWGPNMRVRPRERFREFARAVIEAGADVFWGHSAHVVQGVEVFRGRPILYDTGDFVDDYMVDAQLRNDLSAIFFLRVSPPSLDRLELAPVRIGEERVNPATGRDRDWFLRRFHDLSAELGTPVEVHDGRSTVPLGTIRQPEPK